MRSLTQIPSIIFILISFLVGLIAGTFNFQLLNYNFWTNTFIKHDVYNSLAISGKNSFESQIIDEGGNKNDVKILTDLITPQNAKDVVERNLKNFLNFANGKVSQIYVYLPVNKIPTNLLPKNISGIKTEMPIQDILTKFNFQDYQNLPIESMSRLSRTSSLIFYMAMAFFILAIISLFFLVESKKRFISLSIAFILSGGLTVFLAQVVAVLSTNISTQFISSSSISSVITGIIIPPLLIEILTIWRYLGMTLILLGLIFLFVKKKSLNNSK